MSTCAIPIIRSSRLMLRALGEQDHASLLALAHEPAVNRYLHEGALPTISEIAARVTKSRRQWALRGYGMMGVEDVDGFVGRLGVFYPAEVTDPLLVYALNRRSWGRGYATEGVGAFLLWLRESHRPLRLLAQIDPHNEASARVAAKVGGTRTGTTSRAGDALDVWIIDI